MEPIFVVGSARSGTTYLARALALPDEVAYWEESAMFGLYGARRFPAEFSRCKPPDYPASPPPLLRGLSLIDKLRGKDRLMNLLDDLWRHAKLGPHDLKPSGPLVRVQGITLSEQELAEIRIFHGQLTTMDWQDAFRAVLDRFASLTGKSILLEKTPLHLRYVPHIHEVFPNAKVVCITRDKKDSIASYLKNFQPRSNKLEQLKPFHWRMRRLISESRMDRALENWILSQPYGLEVRFDDMLRDPYGEVERTYRWLGLDLPLEPLREHFVGREPTSNWDKLTGKQRTYIEQAMDL